MAKKKVAKKAPAKKVEEVEINMEASEEVDIFAEEEAGEEKADDSQESESLASEELKASDSEVKAKDEDHGEDFATADLKEKRLVGRHPITKEPVYK